MIYTSISPKIAPKIEFFKPSIVLNIKYSFETILKINTYIYIYTYIKDIYQKYSKHFQAPTRDLLDPMVELVRWCPYLELEPLKLFHNET